MSNKIIEMTDNEVFTVCGARLSDIEEVWKNPYWLDKREHENINFLGCVGHLYKDIAKSACIVISIAISTVWENGLDSVKVLYNGLGPVANSKGYKRN